MAFCEFHFFSDVLGREVNVNVILPEAAEYRIGLAHKESETACCKTLWLLHGLSDNHSVWCRRTSVERYAEQYGIAVVMPDVERSWYNDIPGGYGDYFTYLTDELPQKCRGFFRQMSAAREDNLIGGLSMGGYGALKAAYTYPERYAAVMGLSSALLNHRLENDGDGSAAARYAPFFGDLSDFADSKKNVLHLAGIADPASLPPTYLWCGEQDPLLPDTLALTDLLQKKGVKVSSAVTPGVHAWQYWDEQLSRAIPWMLSQIG